MFRMNLFALVGLMCFTLMAQDEAEAPPEVKLKDLAEVQAFEASLAAKSMMTDAQRLGSTLYVVGDRGHILASRDGGKTWDQQPVPTRNMLTGVHFVTEQLGFAVGHDEMILRTKDGGRSWQKVRFNPDAERPLLDIWFRDENYGIAIGAYGALLITTDGGETWETNSIGEFEEFHYNAMALSESGKLYIAAEAGNMYRSEDQGQNWTKLESPYEGSFFGVLPLADDVVFMFGLRGNMFRSDDAGETWEEIETQTEAILTDGIQLEDGRIFISGMGGVLLESKDGGETFKLHQQADRQGIAKLLPSSGDKLYLVGEAGVWSYKP